MKNTEQDLSLEEMRNITGGGEWSNVVVEFLTSVGDAFSYESKNMKPIRYGYYAGMNY